MSNLEHLRQAAENTLHELTADEALKNKIFQKAADQNNTDTHPSRSLRPIPLLCSFLAVLLIGVFALNALQPVPSSVPGELNSFTAGSSDSNTASIFPDDFIADSVSSIKLDETRIITDQNQCSLLVGILLNQAVQTEASESLSQESMIITVLDGSVFSFELHKPFLISQDGHWWSCPDFFTELDHTAE